MNKCLSLILLGLTIWTIPASLSAASGPRSGPVIARGEERDTIKSLDITERPDRWGHFYGNTVRRRTDRTSDAGRRVATRGR